MRGVVWLYQWLMTRGVSCGELLVNLRWSWAEQCFQEMHREMTGPEKDQLGKKSEIRFYFFFFLLPGHLMHHDATPPGHDNKATLQCGCCYWRNQELQAWIFIISISCFKNRQVKHNQCKKLFKEAIFLPSHVNYSFRPLWKRLFYICTGLIHLYPTFSGTKRFRWLHIFKSYLQILPPRFTCSPISLWTKLQSLTEIYLIAMFFGAYM